MLKASSPFWFLGDVEFEVGVEVDEATSGFFLRIDTAAAVVVYELGTDSRISRARGQVRMGFRLTFLT